MVITNYIVKSIEIDLEIKQIRFDISIPKPLSEILKMGRIHVGILYVSLYLIVSTIEKKHKNPKDLEDMQSAISRVLRLSDTIAEDTTTERVIHGTCICSKIYDPVCGSNKKSYYNTCLLECDRSADNITVLHQGNCIPF